MPEVKDELIQVDDVLVTDSEGNHFIPYNVSIRLVNGRVLKGVAKVEYAHMVIADIAILETRGRTVIRFPSTRFEDKKTGEQRTATVAFPAQIDVSKAFNQGIMKAYKEQCSLEYLKRVAESAKKD